VLGLPNTSDSFAPNTSQEVAELIELDPRVREQDGPFEFWYRWTAPPRQPLSASFEEREAARQGRLVSTVLAMVAGSLLFLTAPAAVATHNPQILGSAGVLLLFVIIALFLNRAGKGKIGSWLVVIMMNIGLCISLLTYRGGLTTNTLPNMDILVVEPMLVALVLLPPVGVFSLAIFDIVFLLLDFHFEPYAPDLAQLMTSNGYAIITRPIYLMLFVIAIVYPVMRSVLRAIVMGDRAKEIAKVQRDLANREALVAQEKKVLDNDIQQLVDALTQIANGNLRARLPVPATQSLWPITGALNNLYARLRSARQSEYELQHTRASAAALIRAIRWSRQSQQELLAERNGNPIVDAIILELMSNSNHDNRPTTRPLSQDMPRAFRRPGLSSDGQSIP
jgi:hypothetical protein